MALVPMSWNSSKVDKLVALATGCREMPPRVGELHRAQTPGQTAHACICRSSNPIVAALARRLRSCGILTSVQKRSTGEALAPYPRAGTCEKS